MSAFEFSVSGAQGASQGPASKEEAAAIVAALERFARETAPAPPKPQQGSERWLRAGRLEAVRREEERDLFDPWINT